MDAVFDPVLKTYGSGTPEEKKKLSFFKQPEDIECIDDLTKSRISTRFGEDCELEKYDA